MRRRLAVFVAVAACAPSDRTRRSPSTTPVITHADEFTNALPSVRFSFEASPSGAQSDTAWALSAFRPALPPPTRQHAYICPMPVLTLSNPMSMPTDRRPIASLPYMPIDSTGCHNPLFRPDSLNEPESPQR
jgi:hypothetical protein